MNLPLKLPTNSKRVGTLESHAVPGDHGKWASHHCQSVPLDAKRLPPEEKYYAIERITNASDGRKTKRGKD